MLQASCSGRSVCVLHWSRGAKATVPFVHLDKRNEFCCVRPHTPAPLRRVRVHGFFDNVFRRNKAHAPELVRLDVENEGGLGDTSSELFGPLVRCPASFAPSSPVSGESTDRDQACRQSCWSAFKSRKSRSSAVSCLTWMQTWSR